MCVVGIVAEYNRSIESLLSASTQCPLNYNSQYVILIVLIATY